MTARRYAARYGNLALLVTRFTDDGDGRDWATQSPAIGNQHVLQDRGLRLRKTTVEILFCDEPNAGSYLDRFLAFRELARASSSQLFVHPIHGAYDAVVADLTPSVDAGERSVRVSCAFLEADPPQLVADLGAGTVAPVGPEAVGVQAAATTAALTAAGTTSATPAACLAAVTAWAEAEEVDARAIALEAASLAAQLDELLEDLVELAHWPAYKAAVLLRYAVARAASSVTSETSRITSFTLDAAEPLLSLCARFYGAKEAQERSRQVAKLNGLRTPGLLRAGTTIKLPVVAR